MLLNGVCVCAFSADCEIKDQIFESSKIRFFNVKETLNLTDNYSFRYVYRSIIDDDTPSISSMYSITVGLYILI